MSFEYENERVVSFRLCIFDVQISWAMVQAKNTWLTDNFFEYETVLELFLKSTFRKKTFH